MGWWPRIQFGGSNGTEHDEIDPRQERKLLLGPMGVCGLFLAVGVVLGSEPSVGQTLALGDLSEAHIVEIRDAEGRTMLSGEFRTLTDPRETSKGRSAHGPWREECDRRG